MSKEVEDIYNAILDAVLLSDETSGRVAKALFDVGNTDKLKRAQALISALREMDEPMIQAGIKASKGRSRQIVIDVFQAMMDVAWDKPPPGLLMRLQVH
jgi:hypothetical protein